MSVDRPDLTALIGSRICHDLISPLGAIGNGVELIGMSGRTGPEIDLIAESVENANARIRFFRIAYGAAGTDQPADPRDLAAILRDYTRGTRLVIDWQAQGNLLRPQVKLAFLLLQCFESALPRGGHVAVRQLGQEWALTAEAEVLAIDPELWAMLAKSTARPDLRPAEVQFPLAARAAEAIGRRLILETSERSARVRF